MSGVTGSARLRHVARLVREAGDADLRKEMRRAINAPLAPFRTAVRDETSTLPGRGGYAALMAKSLRVQASVKSRGRGAGLAVEVLAKGRAEERDVASVNAGRLRHKIFGHLPWVDQAVPPGFVSRPALRMIAAIGREVADGLDRIAAKISKG